MHKIKKGFVLVARPSPLHNSVSETCEFYTVTGLEQATLHGRSRSVVVITSALHAECPRFDPGRDQ